MEIALKLALKGVGNVNPNPLVGSIIVKEGKIIGQGYHEYYGGKHAERNAIENSKECLEGSTIYITLEPCFHYGKTPPCVDLIIKKKFKRVVVGMLDPNPLVKGKSIEKMKKNGIEVIVGVKEYECRKINEVFIKYITSKIPYVVLKSAISLDGKIATKTGESKWITCEEARMHTHEIRKRLSAIMVGVNTVIIDNPQLTYRGNNTNNFTNTEEKIYDTEKDRLKEVANPIRIIVDSNLRIPLEAKVVKNNDNRTIIATTIDSDKIKKNKLKELGVKIIETKRKDGKVDLDELIVNIGAIGIDSILIEGGGTLNFSALKEKIVDKVIFYIAPKIIGGDKSRTSVEGDGFINLSDAVNLNEISYSKIGSDLLVEGYINQY